MSKSICFLEQLPDADLWGTGMRRKTDYTKQAGRFVLKYASITGLFLGALSLAVTIGAIV